MNEVKHVALAVVAVAGAVGCDRLGLGPRQADSAPSAPAAASVPDFRPHAERTYADFAAAPGFESYGLSALGLSEAEQARFARNMADAAPGRLVAGGGAEALVFSGCAAGGCAEGMSVLAIDLATGAAFVGVRDADGADELAPNHRVEALLRLMSASRRWDELGGGGARVSASAGP